MKTRGLTVAAVVSGLIGMAAGCGRGSGAGTASTEEAQVANVAGDTMASADEAAQGGGLAMLTPADRLQRRGHSATENVLDFLLPIAEASNAATTCDVTFSGCTSAMMTSSISCQNGAASLTESSSLTFSGPDSSSCHLNTMGDSVYRYATATLSYNGYSVAVDPMMDGGQTLANVDGGFALTVEGMERKGTLPDGGLFFDFTTATNVGSPIMLTHTGIPATRSNRVMNGTLIVDHKLANYMTTLTANQVAWSSTCNCATSGSFSAANTNNSSWTLTLTGCGTASLTGTREDGGMVDAGVTFDRCHML